MSYKLEYFHNGKNSDLHLETSITLGPISLSRLNFSSKSSGKIHFEKRLCNTILINILNRHTISVKAFTVTWKLMSPCNTCCIDLMNKIQCIKAI